MKAKLYNKRWHRREMLFKQSIPATIESWLFDVSSLTRRLIQHCPDSFRVEVISQSVKRPALDEARELNIAIGRSALIREVLLYCGEQAVVYARTVIPLATLTGAQNSYANLGNRPLGAMLFADRTMRREEVEITSIRSNEVPYENAGDEDIWGRRSVFRVGGKPLLVAEFFLPALY